MGHQKSPTRAKYAADVKKIAESTLKEAFSTKEKGKRQDLVAAAKKAIGAGIAIPADDPNEKVLLGDAFKGLEMDIMRGDVLKTKRRIDGRDLKTVRPILSEVHVLPRTHGSALFTRGETQALVVATLGTGEDEQYIDSLEGTKKERFLLHYNFPPYSVGEVGRMGSPGRRAKSATASLLGAPSVRCCRRRKSFPTRSASSRKSPSRTVRRRWQRSAAPRSH